MSNYNSLYKRKKALEKELATLQNYLDSAPEGTLISRQKSIGQYKYYNYRLSPDGKKKETYIPQSNAVLAEKLACKAYAAKRLSDCKKELRILSDYLSFYGSEKEADRFLKAHPGAAKLILPLVEHLDAYAKQWQEAPYIRSEIHPEDLIYPTLNPNLKVRSKSEGDIYGRLVFFQVPRRYEEQIIINGIAIHPDFTCLNVRTREVFYWEHQGAWDKLDYVHKLPGREDQYRMAGIIPWKNLIITTETKNQPLDINWVDTLIQYFLL